MFDFFDPVIAIDSNGFAVEPVTVIDWDVSLADALQHSASAEAEIFVLQGDAHGGVFLDPGGAAVETLLIFDQTDLLTSVSVAAIAAADFRFADAAEPVFEFGYRPAGARLDGGTIYSASDGEYSDVDGDGWPDKEIVVTGGYDKDPKLGKGDDGGGGGWDTGGGTGGGGVDQPPIQDQPDCRDTAAVNAKDQINSRPDYNNRELSQVIYRDSTGQVRQSLMIEGAGPRITFAEILAGMEREGITASQVIGFVHNHDREHYRTGSSLDEQTWSSNVNRYPSTNDWRFADEMVRLGQLPSFALYIIDTSGKMREFNYEGAPLFRALTESQRAAGSALPGETVPGSCG